MSGRASGAARVDADAGIAVRHPLLRVDHFPVLVLVRRAPRDVWMLDRHALPLIGVEVFEVEPFAVRAVGQDDRALAPLQRPIDVGAKDEAVVHADRDVPVYAHPVANLAREIGHGRGASWPAPSTRPPRRPLPQSAQVSSIQDRRTKSNVAAFPPAASCTRITRSRLKMGSRPFPASPGKYSWVVSTGRFGACTLT